MSELLTIEKAKESDFEERTGRWEKHYTLEEWKQQLSNLDEFEVQRWTYRYDFVYHVYGLKAFVRLFIFVNYLLPLNASENDLWEECIDKWIKNRRDKVIYFGHEEEIKYDGLSFRCQTGFVVPKVLKRSQKVVTSDNSSKYNVTEVGMPFHLNHDFWDFFPIPSRLNKDTNEFRRWEFTILQLQKLSQLREQERKHIKRENRW